METVWTFKTARFAVTLALDYQHGYEYDGDDENGETQAKLDSGEYVAFDSCVTVKLDGDVIGRDWLGSSVYAADEVSEFWTAHRLERDPAYRNTLANKARKVCICHYFPDMVRQAIAEARKALHARQALYVRAVA